MMKVLFIDKVMISGFFFPRFRYLIPHLRGEIEAELVEVNHDGEIRTASLLRKALNCDVVFARNLLNPWMIRALRAACERTFLEIDTPEGPDLEKEGGRDIRKLISAGKAAKYLLLQGANHMRVMKRKVLNVSLFPPTSPEPTGTPEGKLPPPRDNGVVVLCEGPSKLLKTMERARAELESASEEVGGMMIHMRSDSLVSPGKVRFFFERSNALFNPPSELSPEIFIYPVFRGKNDHFGTSPNVLNALSLGIPCLAPGTDVDRRILKDGENILLFKTPEEFGEKLRLLLARPELRARLGSAGKKAWMENFSPEAVAPFYPFTIEKALENSK